MKEGEWEEVVSKAISCTCISPAPTPPPRGDVRFISLYWTEAVICEAAVRMGINKGSLIPGRNVNFSVTYSRGWFIHYLFSLLSKRFRAGVREQRITASKRRTVEGKKEHLSFLPHPSFSYFWLSSHFCAGKTPKSFFAPQIHGTTRFKLYKFMPSQLRMVIKYSR